ncbi:hypothetical protein [Curtobacterium luteum]|uniref:Uncharacterized protein n=1 Tax=Curtobacterium luteum TaxID=33881 RepID=A0A175RU51_9MICO|nr:hypothetical protein [Curtobacterium luteum]KTR07230.1 hypothetical protein NS184_08095 [Curtobacterium luteum]
MQQRGTGSPGPIWGAPPAPSPPAVRRGSWWAVGGIVAASVGFAAAALGALFGFLALVGNGLIYAASQGSAGSTRAFVELTRFGDLFVVLPLTLIAAVCVVLAWRDTRGPGRSRVSTIVATAMTSALALLALLTTLVFI